MHDDIAAAVAEANRALVRSGLNHGTAGNVSARDISACDGAAMRITPTGLLPERTDATLIARVPLDDSEKWSGPVAPSSEWRLHRDIYRARADVGAIVHTHSAYATVLATQHRDIPALHYMIAAFGDRVIRCTPYAPFGTQALSDLIVEHLGHRHGVLLGNHGMVATGDTLDQAMWRAGELEALAKLAVLASAGGGTPVLLSAEEIARTIERFAGYGMTARDRSRE